MCAYDYFEHFVINSQWEKTPNFRVTYKHYLNISVSHNTTYSQGFSSVFTNFTQDIYKQICSLELK